MCIDGAEGDPQGSRQDFGHGPDHPPIGDTKSIFRTLHPPRISVEHDSWISFRSQEYSRYTCEVLPGADFGNTSPRILSTGNLTLNGRLYALLFGGVVGTDYGQVKVTGTVTLAATANLYSALYFVPTINQTFVVIDNDGLDPVVGTFNGLPEGTTITLGGGHRFQLSYQGGTGNDVVLTCTFVAKSWTGASGTLWSDAGNWAGGAPAAGDDLYFPSSGSNKANTNDLAVGTVFNQIVFSGGGYTIGGNAFGLVAGISGFGGSDRIDADIKLAASQSFLGSGANNGLTLHGIDLNGYSLTLRDLTVSGVVVGSGSVTTESQVRFSGNNTYTGSSTFGGQTEIDGSQPSIAVQVNSLLSGNGTAGDVTTSAYGEVLPGADFGNTSPRILSTGNLTLNGRLYALLFGGVVGTDYGQVKVTGTVTLAATANLYSALYFVPTINQTFVVIDNDGLDPVVGTFNGLPEGTTITLDDFYPFKISYIGGDGNDVVLTSLSGAEPSTTSLASAPSPSTPGQAVLFTATVTGSGSTPTGTVTFLESYVALGSGTLSGGVATFSTSSLSAGNHSIYAKYSGDATFGTSNSPVLTQVVAIPASTLVVSPASGFTGGTISLSATLGSTAPVGGRSVAFLLNGAAVGSATTNVSGAVALAGVSLSGIAAGIYPGGIVASFGGDATLRPSSGSASLTVQQSDPTPPTATVTQPNGGERAFTGSPYVFQWTASDNVGVTSIDVAYSTNGGSTFNPVPGCAGLSGSASSCVWAAPGPATTTGRVRVTAHDAAGNLGSDDSNANFSIITGTASVTVTAPNTAVSWRIGDTTRQVKFNHTLGTGQKASIDVSRDGGATWSAINPAFTTTAATTGTYSWPAVTGPPTTQALARVVWSGSPTVADAGNMTFKIADRVTVTAPNTAVTWTAGTLHAVTWTHNLGASDLVSIDVSRDSGVSWSPVAAGLPAAGTYTWSVTGPATTQARIRVAWAANPSNNDVSDIDFKIVAPSITSIAPNGGQSWRIADNRNITFTHNLGTGQTINFEISRDGGATFSSIGTFVTTSATSGSFPWIVAGPATVAARVRASWASDGTVQATSAANSAIADRISITQPNTNVTWAIGSNKNLKFSHNLGVGQPVSISVSRDGGATWTLITTYTTTGTNETVSWIVTGPATSAARIQVSWNTNPAVSDISDMNFKIQ